ncbi:MAG TPA: cob(I)yrinic acid a,c-diamide adenosyltransferase [Syntrophomonas sp.]|jgi:cob(I)alamin adenosyltransferase|nr:cob(I)yrinic acid a,c-diamide adenosyltransferase [Syntrophomonas sp.]
MILIFTGDGKGKTSSAAGTALRAWGQGRRVLFISFLKGNNIAGENKAIKRINDPNFQVNAFGRECPYPGTDCCPGQQECIIRAGKLSESDYKQIKLGLDRLYSEIATAKWDLIVLDEIINVYNLFESYREEILQLLDQIKADTDLVLTGRNSPLELCSRADLISEIKALKHPYQSAMMAKRGIDY